jgi:hypothetical protein
MKWAIILVMVAGFDGKPTAIEHVPTEQTFTSLEKCRERANRLNAYTEMPPINNGILSEHYSCVAR